MFGRKLRTYLGPAIRLSGVTEEGVQISITVFFPFKYIGVSSGRGKEGSHGMLLEMRQRMEKTARS